MELPARNGRPCHKAGRRHSHGQCLDKVPREQHSLAPETVAEQGGDGGEDHGRDELYHPDHPRGGCPAGLVGEDQDCDPGPQLGRVEADEGELHPPEVGVGEDGPEYSQYPGKVREYVPHAA